jgi:mannose-1-phosphate guanylyltransferase
VYPREDRPWGYFLTIKEEKRSKIKKIVVKPGKRLSLQKHLLREETWIVLRGKGKAVVGKNTIDIEKDSVVFVKKKQIHRIINTGRTQLVILELQQGVCKESDIIRIEDDFGRTGL